MAADRNYVLQLTDSQQAALYDELRRLDLARPNNDKIGTLEGLLMHWVKTQERKFLEAKEARTAFETWLNGLSIQQQLDFYSRAKVM